MHLLKKSLGFIITIFILLPGCQSQNPAKVATTGQTPQIFEKEIVKHLKAGYLLYLPESYTKDTEKSWPMILFLHGAGERGDNLELVKVEGLPKNLETIKDFPFIVISPQCPAEAEGWSVEILKELVDDVVKKYRIDQDRMYLTGLSMGGIGTWSLAVEYPGMFAAIAPICGRVTDHRLERLKNTPVWVFHGALDKTIPIENSKDAVDELTKMGADVKFTVYPDAGHDSWTETYNNPELYDWFLRYKGKTGNK